MNSRLENDLKDFKIAERTIVGVNKRGKKVDQQEKIRIKVCQKAN